jgi:Na+-transporting NADH:ubiquinone oxidoreductase subunit NqrB
MKIPQLRDPRYLQATVLLSYALVARGVFHSERSHWVTLGCCLWAILLDLALGRWLYQNTLFPISAFIIGMSASLLIDAHSVVTYLGVVTLAIVSKAFVTYKGRHYFNPTNFGVVVVLLLGYGQVTGNPTLFGGSILTSWIFLGLGLTTAIYAGQAAVSLSWLGSFIILALVRGVIEQGNPWLKVELIFGTSLLLFSFHMINDPSTVPHTRKLKILYGISIASLDAVFRFKQIYFGAFYALFMASCFLPWIWDFEAKTNGHPKLLKSRI